jgi:hypothetical protein
MCGCILCNPKQVRLISTLKKGGRAMPYLVTTVYYPSDIIDEVIKTYLDMVKKYPYDKSLGEEVVHGSIRTRDGIKVLHIIDVKKGKLEKAVDFSNKRLAMFYGVDGYESKTQIYSTIEEGFDILGLKAP